MGTNRPIYGKSKSDLMNYNWNKIYKEKYTNKVYNEFLATFNRLYDKNCPITQVNRKNKCNDTNGSRRA